jgi:hypothetical protein
VDALLLYFDDCPNWRVAEQRLREALDATGHETVAIRRELVTTIEEAQRRNFYGSPTIVINGLDPFASGDEEPALACRVYASPAGLSGSPSVGQIIAALTQ